MARSKRSIAAVSSGLAHSMLRSLGASARSSRSPRTRRFPFRSEQGIQGSSNKEYVNVIDPPFKKQSKFAIQPQDKLCTCEREFLMVENGQSGVTKCCNFLPGFWNRLIEKPSLSLRLFADVEFELPALFAVAADARQFQRADFRHFAVQMHRHCLP